ncbi:NHL repeat-containing protein [Candidatus Woesearchaeota archaeon]|nr:NHL repeat-containing protein [Candidatus Woesearchaeota archaeon]
MMKKGVAREKIIKYLFVVFLLEVFFISAQFFVPTGKVVTEIYATPIEYNDDASLQYSLEETLGIKGINGSTSAQFNFPEAISFSDQEMIYVADTMNKRVQVLGKAKSYVRTFEGFLEKPVGVATGNNGEVYVADEVKGIYILNKIGSVTKRITEAGGKQLKPVAVATDTYGKVYVASGNRVFILDKDGGLISTIGKDCQNCFGKGEFLSVSGVAVKNDGSRIYVADGSRTGEQQNYRVQAFDSKLNHLFTIGGLMPSATIESLHPFGLEVDEDGLLYVADPIDHRIKIFDAQGKYVKRIGNLNPKSDDYLGFVIDVEVDSLKGKIYALSRDQYVIRIFLKQHKEISRLIPIKSEPVPLPKVEEEQKCSGCSYDKQCLSIGVKIKTEEGDKYCGAKGLEKTKELNSECTNNYECVSNVCKENLCKPACEGCIFKDYCLFTGARVEAATGPAFCDFGGIIAPQKQEATSCQNNYECLTNQCEANKCFVKRSLFQKIGFWLKKVFS